MTQSSGWSQAVVVRAEGDQAVIAPPTPASSAARLYAAAGNPILVRPRDPARLTCAQDGRGGGAEQTGMAASGALGRGGALVSAVLGRQLSETFWIPDPAMNEVGLLEALYRRGASNRTYLLLQSRPLLELQYNFSTCTGDNIDLSHNAFRLSKTAMALHHMDRSLDAVEEEMMLQEQRDVESGRAARTALSPRAGGSTTGVSSSSGSSSKGYSSAYNSDPSAGPSITLSTRDLKHTMRASLQSLQEEDYYLVKYRDYSAWAITEYRALAKSDGLWGRKYVEQCFAIHVGREPGEFIPITEAQFLFGVDIMQRQLLNQLHRTSAMSARGDANRNTYMQYQLDINYSALNSDQFRSLGVILSDGLRPVGVAGEEQKAEAARLQKLKEEQQNARRRLGAEGGDFYYDYAYSAPAWYDWSPSAVRARVRHRLRGYYHSLGRFTVQLALFGLCGFLVYRSVRDYLPAGLTNGHGGDYLDEELYRSERGRGGPSGGGRYRRREGRYEGHSRYGSVGDGGGGCDGADGEGGYRRVGLLRSIFLGPKEVMDYLLAP